MEWNKPAGNEQKNIIYYEKNDNEISFFFNNILLFRHTVKSPIISIIMQKGEAEKEIPLPQCDIKKVGENDYFLNFTHRIYRINVRLRLVGDVINAEVKNPNRYGIIKFELSNKAGRIRGLGLNNNDSCNSKEYTSPLYYENNNKCCFEDKILTFTKKESYFFNVKGSFEWCVRFAKKMEFYIKNVYYFNINVIFGENIDILHEKLRKNFENITKFKEGKIIECSLKNVQERLNRAKIFGEKISTIILNDDYIPFWELFEFRQKFIKYGIKILLKMMPKISEKDDYYNEFNDDDFLKNKENKAIFDTSENGRSFYFNLANQETIRKVKNYIRRLFGTNIDGVLSIEKGQNSEIKKFHIDKLTGISYLWQTMLYEASKENFTNKILVYDKLTPLTPYYGYYLMPTKNALSFKKRIFIKNLRNSGVFNVGVRVRYLKKFQVRRIQNKLKQKLFIINS